MDDPSTLTVRDFVERPRNALMWPPRALDVARLAAVARAVAASPTPSVLDAGAGSGLLARLLADEGLDVTAVDAVDADQPAMGVGRFFDVARESVRDLPPRRFDLVVVSWMEAGRDYRDAVSERARAVAVAHDPAGGCGVRGATGFEPFGFEKVREWSTPSWEDVGHAWRTRGRGPTGHGLARPGGPGNVLEAWAREPDVRARAATAVDGAVSTRRYPWEDGLDALGLPGR